MWIFTKDRNVKYYYEDLQKSWRYKTSLDKVMKIYIDEGIFKIINENNKEVIVEGDALSEMYKKYGDREDAYDIIGAWVSGLIISRLHEEADAPDFKAVNGIIKALAEKVIDSEGNIKAMPYTKVVGYRCKICGAKFSRKDEVCGHLINNHFIPSDEVMAQVEEESITTGHLLELEYLLDVLRREGVSPERFIDRMEKLAILISKDSDTPRIVDQDGKRYIVIDPSWVRIVARTRTREREFIRSYERVR
jgi:hypothetical protein